MLQGLQPTRKPIPGGMSWMPQPQQVQLERAIPVQSETVAFSHQNSNIIDTSCPLDSAADAAQEQQ